MTNHEQISCFAFDKSIFVFSHGKRAQTLEKSTSGQRQRHLAIFWQIFGFPFFFFSYFEVELKGARFSDSDYLQKAVTVWPV